MTHLPAYLWALTYAEVTGIAAATAFGLYRGARAARLGDRVATMMGLGAALLFGAWLAVSSSAGRWRQLPLTPRGTASLGCRLQCSVSWACCSR